MTRSPWFALALCVACGAEVTTGSTGSGGGRGGEGGAQSSASTSVTATGSGFGGFGSGGIGGAGLTCAEGAEAILGCNPVTQAPCAPGEECLPIYDAPGSVSSFACGPATGLDPNSCGWCSADAPSCPAGTVCVPSGAGDGHYACAPLCCDGSICPLGCLTSAFSPSLELGSCVCRDAPP